MMKVFVTFVMLLAAAFAFHAPGVTRPARMTMLFASKGKPSPTTSYKAGEGSANKGTYVPEGLTPAQYAAFQKKEAEAKAAKAKKFPKGKEILTLTDWMLQEKAKGYEGKDLLKKGHRMVKAKYDSFYTNESPV